MLIDTAFQPIGGGVLRRTVSSQQTVERDTVPHTLLTADDRIEQHRKGGPHLGERRYGGGQMPPCRTPHNTHPVCRQSISVCPLHLACQDAQCLFEILARHFGVSVGHTVFQHGGRNSPCGQPACYVDPLVGDSQRFVGSARAEYNSLSRSVLRIGGEEVEHRLADIFQKGPRLGAAFGQGDSTTVRGCGVVPDFDREALPVLLWEGLCGCLCADVSD